MPDLRPLPTPNQRIRSVTPDTNQGGVLGACGALAVDSQAVSSSAHRVSQPAFVPLILSHVTHVLALGLACLALSCARGAEPLPVEQQRCSCAYVTDFDAPGHVDIQVCAATADLEAVAQSCASSSGVGVVSGCQCRPTGSKCGSLPPCAVVDLDRPTLPR